MWRCLLFKINSSWPNRTKIKSLRQVRGPQMRSDIRVLQCESKEPEDRLSAYAWAVELAEASWHLLYEFVQRYELGYFAQPSDDLDARDGQP